MTASTKPPSATRPPSPNSNAAWEPSLTGASSKPSSRRAPKPPSKPPTQPTDCAERTLRYITNAAEARRCRNWRPRHAVVAQHGPQRDHEQTNPPHPRRPPAPAHHARPTPTCQTPRPRSYTLIEDAQTQPG